MVTIMDANIKNVPNKVSMIATGLSTQYGATGSCAFLTFAWCCLGVCFHANRPHNNKNAPIRKNNMLYNLISQYFRCYVWDNFINQVNHKVGKKHHRETTYNNLNTHILNIIPPCIYLVNHLFRKKNLTLISIQIAVKIYSSKSLNGALMWIGK